MRFGNWMVTGAAIGLVAACSTTTGDSGSALEGQLFDRLTQQLGYKPESVECPGPLKAEKGAIRTCVVLMDDHKYEVVATATRVEGANVSFDMNLSDTPIGFKPATDDSTIKTDGLVKLVTDFLKTAPGAPAFKVNCPEELPTRKDAKVTCYLHSEGKAWDVTVSVTSANGDKSALGVQVADKPRS